MKGDCYTCLSVNIRWGSKCSLHSFEYCVGWKSFLFIFNTQSLRLSPSSFPPGNLIDRHYLQLPLSMEWSLYTVLQYLKLKMCIHKKGQKQFGPLLKRVTLNHRYKDLMMQCFHKYIQLGFIPHVCRRRLTLPNDFYISRSFLTLTVYKWNQMVPFWSIWFHVYTVRVKDLYGSI